MSWLSKFWKQATGTRLSDTTVLIATRILLGQKPEDAAQAEICRSLAKRLLPYVADVRTGLTRSAAQGQAALTALEDEVRRWTE